jgi:hypothetical protein
MKGERLLRRSSHGQRGASLGNSIESPPGARLPTSSLQTTSAHPIRIASACIRRRADPIRRKKVLIEACSFAVSATFFVLGNKPLTPRPCISLVTTGYEVGKHTATHQMAVPQIGLDRAFRRFGPAKTVL